MMDRWKRRLAALLAALMLVSLAPTAALAEERAEVPPDAVMAEESRPAVSEAAEESEPNAAQTRKAGADSAEDQAQAMSLLPLEEVELRLDLNDAGIFWSELDAVPVATLLDLTCEYASYYGYGEKIVAEEGDIILWAKADGYADDDEMPDAFTQVGLDGTMDLTPISDSYSSLTLHLIVGKPDQLLTTNTRYKVTLELPDRDENRHEVLSMEGYFLPKEGDESDARTPVDVIYSYGYNTQMREDNEWVDCYYTYITTRESTAKKENDIALKLTLNAPYDTLTPQAYYGFFSTQEELDAAIAKAKNSKSSQLQPGADITDQLFPTGSIETEGGFTLYAKNDWEDKFTLVLKRGDKVVWMTPVQIDMYITGDYIYVSYDAYDPENPSTQVGRHYTYEDAEIDGGYFEFRVFRMNQKKANEECLIRATYEHEDDYDADYTLYVEKVVASTEKFYYNFKEVENLPDVKEDFFGNGYKADYSNGVYFSVFGKEEGNPLLDIVAVKTYGPSMSAGTGTVFSGEDSVATRSSSLSYGKTRVFTMLNEETPATGKYSYRTGITFNGNSASSSEELELADYVEKAVAGTRYYDSLADAKSQTDIKDKLLYINSADEAAGYEADFSSGVHFTIFWYDGTVTKFIVKTEPYVVPETAPQEASRDTYFYVNGAKKPGSAESKTTLNAWAMPGTVDGYYFGYAEDSTNYGVQTVFLLDGSDALEDGTTIYPTFYVGNGVTVYAGHTQPDTEAQPEDDTQTGDDAQPGDETQPGDDAQTGSETQTGNEAQTGSDAQTGDETQTGGETEEPGKRVSGEKQISGESPVTFHSGEAIQYSAAAEDNTLAKNYWVTFVTKQTGPKLYANAYIDDLKDKKEPNNPVRSVQLDGAHNFYHDIFFANIGDEPLEGLSVELNATNVELDPYWTVGETKTLAPFTTTSEGYSIDIGMLPNVAKIRLLPKKNADGSMATGDIEGTITIKSTNGGELTFDLTGKAQEAQIVTETLAKGVRYVPYNSMIQTDVMGASDAVIFTYTGRLPEGVTLFPNGKLYGVPTGRAGDYPITVTATYVAPGDSSITSVSKKEFTLTVLDNTDENVSAAIDKGYELRDRVDDIVTGSSEQVFHSDGDLSRFMYLYLDGVKLVKNKDYTVEEGSTRIVIQGQALRSKGSGTHTLAAEFRTNSSDTNTVKRAAQNYTVPGGSGSGTSGRSSSTISEITKPKEPEKVVAFQDVKASAWYYDDVMTVAKGGLMIGVGDELFAPDALISQPMVVTILSRMAKAELPEADDVTGTGVEAGQWYTPAAVWAWRSGIVGDGTFAAVPPLNRGDLATTLARYLDYALVTDPAWKTADAAFADEDQMTEEQLEAFRKLYAIGILKGVGGDYMAPQRATSRAELAAVIQRLSAYLENQ